MRDVKNFVALLVMLTMGGCASTLPARPNTKACEDVCLSAGGWAENTSSRYATIAVTVHNPRAVLVEATLACGLAGKAPSTTVVRVPAGLQQEVHFSAKRELGFGTFSCALAEVQAFGDLTPQLGGLGGAQ